MDYTSEGKLLVDPQKMMNDGYGDLGKGLGFIIGYFIEKTWIRFKPFKGGTRYTIVCLLLYCTGSLCAEKAGSLACGTGKEHADGVRIRRTQA